MILVVTPNPCLDRTLFIGEHRSEGRVEVGKVEEIAGGKGSNVSRVLRELGKSPIHLLFLGGYVGERVLRLLQADGIDSVPIWTKAPTRVVTTVVDRQWRQVVYFEPPPEIKGTEEALFLDTLGELQRNSQMVLLCGSIPPSLPHFYDQVMQALDRQKVIIDGRGRLLRDLSVYPWGLKMNREEAEYTWGEPLRTEADWEQFFEFFFTQGVEMVIVTFGPRGALLGTPEMFYGVVALSVSAVNPVGSGDAFLGAFVHALSASLSLEEALRWAAAAGASNAMVWEAGRVDARWVAEAQRKIEVVRSSRFDSFREFLVS